MPYAMRAPELVLEVGLWQEVDIWAFGCLVNCLSRTFVLFLLCESGGADWVRIGFRDANRRVAFQTQGGRWNQY